MCVVGVGGVGVRFGFIRVHFFIPQSLYISANYSTWNLKEIAVRKLL